MLIKCPECELQVSDKAYACPHCGYPMKSEAKQKSPRKSNKRRRLPNGFGQISEIKNRNLRSPFRAMVTVGKSPTGRPICKPLKPESYFPTYNDAYAALVEYNKNPYDLSDSITVKELYERWFEHHFSSSTGTSNARSVKSAWSYCSAVYNMRVVELRARHIKGCIDDGIAIIYGEERKSTSSMKKVIKSVFNQMLDYAVEYELVDRNYARTFGLSPNITKEAADGKGHISFSDDELETLWSRAGQNIYTDAMLVQCYSGWRPQEIGLLTLENIDLENSTFKGGMKTDAGTNREIPIHPKIKPIIEARYQEAATLGSKYLFNNEKRKLKGNTQLTYDRYLTGFSKIRDDLGLNPEHRPHDGRVCFVTRAKKYGVDEYAIKYIVGHTISDITEKVYTKRELAWLKEEIEKIK